MSDYAGAEISPLRKIRRGGCKLSCGLLIVDVGLQVDGEQRQRRCHILVLHQDALGDVQMGGGKVPDGLDAAFDQLVGNLLNIALDPLLIFGLGPFPKMGVQGAAVATVAGQIAAAIVAFTLLARNEKNIRLHPSRMMPTLPILKNIFSIALPSMITVGLGSVMSFGMNQILLAFSTTATAIFGIWLKLQNFAFMPIFGMNNGSVPIISFNYGAGRTDRVHETIRIATMAAVLLMSALAVILELVPVQLLQMFNASEQMMAMGKIALRAAVFSLPFGAYTMISSSAFQALNHSRYTLLVSILRQAALIIPLAWVFSLTGNLSMVWLAIPATEILTVFISIYFRRVVFANIDRN